jgi:hypothetical protein
MAFEQSETMHAKMIVFTHNDGEQYLDVEMQNKRTRIKLPTSGNVFDVVKASEWLIGLAGKIKEGK